MVLLPEGKIINNPDTVKLIKVLPTTLNDETFFVVVIKLDDDSELMLDRCASRMSAEALADRCCRLLNGEELDSVDIPSFVESSEQPDVEESSDWDLSEEEESVSPADTTSVSIEEESSDWDFSASGDEGDKEPVPTAPPVEEESSDWDFSASEADSAEKTLSPSPVEEESSDWGFSSEEEDVPPPKKTSKPKIQQPYAEPKIESTADKKSKKSKKATVESTTVKPDTREVVQEQVVIESVQAKPVPRVTGFIEDDSDEWIPDNGLDDWYD